MPIRVNRYPAVGFRLIGSASPCPLLTYEIASGLTITRGYAVFDNGSGYATNVGTNFSSLFLGIAQDTITDAAGTTRDKCKIIPPLPHLQFVAEVGNALITTADTGEICDLHDNHSLDVSDNAVSGYGFKIDEIDVSTAAIAANTEGYAYGHFVSGDVA